jgi:hypothetical protein
MTLIEKWNAFGLLKGFDEQQAAECALLLESVVPHITEEQKQEPFAAVVLPCIRRIYGLIGIFDAVQMMKVLREDYTQEKYESIKGQSYMNLDAEVEYVVCFADCYPLKIGYEFYTPEDDDGYWPHYKKEDLQILKKKIGQF